MTTIQKHQIMQSLESLDQIQTAKVLDYVKSLAKPISVSRQSKHEALKQIRQALGNTTSLHTSF